jgi:hypothetical protein
MIYTCSQSFTNIASWHTFIKYKNTKLGLIIKQDTQRKEPKGFSDFRHCRTLHSLPKLKVSVPLNFTIRSENILLVEFMHLKLYLRCRNRRMKEHSQFICSENFFALTVYLSKRPVN